MNLIATVQPFIHRVNHSGLVIAVSEAHFATLPRGVEAIARIAGTFLPPILDVCGSLAEVQGSGESR